MTASDDPPPLSFFFRPCAVLASIRPPGRSSTTGLAPQWTGSWEGRRAGLALCASWGCRGSGFGKVREKLTFGESSVCRCAVGSGLLSVYWPAVGDGLLSVGVLKKTGGGGGFFSGARRRGGGGLFLCFDIIYFYFVF